jgi:hypothetical protein
MIILAIAVVSIAAMTRGNRKSMTVSNDMAEAYFVSTTFTEGIKSWYADTTCSSRSPNTCPKSVGSISRYEVLFNSLAGGVTRDTVGPGYVRGNQTFYARFTMSQFGNAADGLILAKGRLVWDSLKTSKHTFTWGILLGMPVQ